MQIHAFRPSLELGRPALEDLAATEQANDVGRPLFELDEHDREPSIPGLVAVRSQSGIDDQRTGELSSRSQTR